MRRSSASPHASEASKFVTLGNGEVSLVLEIPVHGLPIWRHLGAALDDVHPWPISQARPRNPVILFSDAPLTVLPTHGLGWVNEPALLGHRWRNEKSGCTSLAWAQDFQLRNCQHEDSQLVFLCADPVAGLELTVRYCLMGDTNVFTAQSVLTNTGNDHFIVTWLAAACLQLPDSACELLYFTGRWSQEFQEQREPLGRAIWRRDNRRGRTSHDNFPGLMVRASGQEGDGWGSAEILGFHLGWSGNHSMVVEPLNDGHFQMQMGEWLAPGEIILAPGQSYSTPVAYFSHSQRGINALSQNFHQAARTIAPPRAERMSSGKVLFNSWEAVYCNHHQDKLHALAERAADLGVECFVLDDGWFHRRNSDQLALGDWWPDKDKYPQGLAPFAAHVKSLGMKFGLWFEPEMVNQDSELYRQHPEWALTLDSRPLVLGRHQLVLDLARPEVFSHLFAAISKVIGDCQVDYLKWDMNRDMATAGHHGHPAYHLHTAALYRLLQKLRRAFPALEIEGCSSGGGRVDFGFLHHTLRFWVSDNNDPLSRVAIQQGFLRFLPPEYMGTHIGTPVSHATNRSSFLDFRGAVAMIGYMGLELDLTQLPDHQLAVLKLWIDTYKAWRNVIHHAKVWQNHDDGCQWFHFVAPQGDQAVAIGCQVHESAASHRRPLRCHGLIRSRYYRCRRISEERSGYFTDRSTIQQEMLDDGVVISGAVLEDFGLPVAPMSPGTACICTLQVES